MTAYYKIIFFALFIMVTTNRVYCQPADTTLSQALTGNHVIEATNSITFAAGFSYDAQSSNQLIANIIPTTGNSNYIFTEPQESGPLQVDTSYHVGSIYGSISVGPTGAANYVIPIDIPPGRNGMKPNLSLVYNSQASEGLLGLGWGLSGLSSITRVPTDFYHEGYIDVVDFDSNDKFALDGERLIPIGGDQYRTENESFSKITLYGSSANPTYFKVETKEGLELYFGNTTDSRVEAQGTSNVYAWNLNQVKDKNGNFYNITYTETTSSGEIYPVSINYSCYESINGDYTIEFGYENRSVPMKTYISGSQILINKLMNLITIKYGTTVVCKLQLVYSNSKISEIIKYGKNNSRINSTFVIWGNVNDDLTESIKPTIPNVISRHQGDFNGDGKPDFAIITGNPNPTCALYLADNTGQLYFRSSQILPASYQLSQIFPGDFNGDGLEDLLIFRLISGVYYPSFLISDGDSFTKIEYGTYIGSSSDTYFTGDYNGNGKIDLMKKSTDQYNCMIYEFNFPAGGGISHAIIGQDNIYWGYHGYSEIYEVPIDMNGDGKTELFIQDRYRSLVYGLSEDSCNLDIICLLPGTNINTTTRFGDFNGDGMTDLFIIVDPQNNLYYLCISTGNGFDVQENYTFSGFIPDYNYFYSCDMNGDGKSDIVAVGKGTNIDNPVNIYVAYSDGQDFNLQTYTPATSIQLSPDYYHFGDYNGDGITDFYYDYNITSKLINTYRGRSQYFVSEIKNGFGYSNRLNYDPLTSDTLYYKGTAASYPVISYQSPLYVVSSISTDNPDFSQSTTSFSYYGAHFHTLGKGFLGYEKITSVNPTANIKSVDEYEYDPTFYNVSLKKKSLYTLPSGSISEELVSRSVFTNSVNDLGDLRYFSYLDSSSDTSYITGVKVTKDYNYDTNGNLTDYREDYDDGSYNIMASSDFSGAGTWLPARPQTVTSTRKHYQDTQSFSLTSTFTYYSTSGQVNTKTVGPLTSAYSYDNFGNLTSDTLSDGTTCRINHLTWDAGNMFIWKSYNALNHVTERTYDYVTGNVITEKSPGNVITEYTYDDFGILTGKSTSALGQSQSVTIGWTTGTRPLGSVYYTQITTSGAPTTKAYYDAFGRVLKTETTGFDGNLVYAGNVYNNKGQLSESSLPYKLSDTPLKKVYIYDKYGRKTGEESTAGIVTFNYTGKTVQVTNSAGQTSSRTSDSQGNILSASDDAGSISYSYKSNGKPGTITSVGSSSSMFYDNLGRQTSLTDPNAGTITYRYNNYNELTKQIDAQGKIDSLTYDILGRVATEVRTEGIKVYTYDPSGNPGLLDSVSYSGGSVKYSYDNASRITGKVIRIDGTSYSDSYGYDSYSRLQTLTYPSGFAIKNVYNAYSYNSEVRRNDNNALIWQGQNVNAFGQFTQYTYGNNLTTAKTYDCLGMLRNKSAGSVQNMDYSYDYETGTMVSRKDNLNNLTEIYTYDNLDRLTGVSGPAPLAMTYASNGNILSKTSIGNYSYETSKPHAVSSVTNPDGLISTTTQRITYTSFNKADSVIQGNLVYTLTYGHEDQRTISRLYDNGNLQKTIYYAGEYEKEVRPGNNIRHLHYIPGGDGLAAIFVRNNGQDTMYYIHTDHLGSINVITNQSDSVIKNYSFDTWGRRRNPADWTYNNVPSTFLFDRGFTGHEHLDQFALINMNGRIYDPITARFLNPDNIVQIPDFTQSFNRYTYCVNNPLKYIDPSGYSYLAPDRPNRKNDPGGGPVAAYMDALMKGYPLSYIDFLYNYYQTRDDYLFYGGGGRSTITIIWCTLIPQGELVSSDPLVMNVYPSLKVWHSVTIQFNDAQSGRDWIPDAKNIAAIGGTIGGIMKTRARINIASQPSVLETGKLYGTVDNILLIDPKLTSFANSWNSLARGCFWFGASVSALDAASYYINGGTGWGKLAWTGADIGIGIIGLVGGPLGMAIGVTYMISTSPQDFHPTPGFLLDPTAPWNTIQRNDNTGINNNAGF
jgi:RHS repeat-associated protein